MARPSNPSNVSAETSARERIVVEARKEFLAHGFRGVTMDDVARQLGMSKKTLYAIFPSKEKLLEAVILAKFAAIEADLKEVVAQSSDVRTALQQLLACIQRHAEEVQPSFLRDLQRQAPETFALAVERRRELLQRYFGKLLDRGRRTGVIRNDIPAKLVMEVLLAAVQTVVTPPKIAELGLTPKSALSSVLTVILEGVVTDKRRAKR